MPYIEKALESRRLSVDTETIRQTVVWVICEEDLTTGISSAEYGAFWAPHDDIGLVKFVYDNLPDSKPFRTSVGTVITLFIQSFSAEQLTGGEWQVTFVYGLPEDEELSNLNYVKFGFSTGGGTEHISKARSVRNASLRQGVAGLAPDNGGAIGMTKNGIKGVDLPARQLKFWVTVYQTPAVWNPAFLITVASLTSLTNNALFMGFPAGEVLFLNADGRGESFKLIPITYNFLHRPNYNNVPDLPFPTLNALGHDTLDYITYPSTSNGLAIQLPHVRYVYENHPPGNLALLGV